MCDGIRLEVLSERQRFPQRVAAAADRRRSVVTSGRCLETRPHLPEPFFIRAQRPTDRLRVESLDDVALSWTIYECVSQWQHPYYSAAFQLQGDWN